MGENSAIEWTHHTHNIVWGCQRVSPACENCYAEAFAKRVGYGKRLPMIWGPEAERRELSDENWALPLKWEREAAAAGERHRVFCSSMADVFEVPPVRNEQATRALTKGRARLWPLIEATPHLDWMLLTKRPENLMGLIPAHWRKSLPVNVWVGVTAEDRRRLHDRYEHLRHVPARVRFLSCEPLLEDISEELAEVLEPGGYESNGPAGYVQTREHGVDLVIVGGESGGGSRPFAVEWARAIVRECRKAGVAAFVKQLGSRPFDNGTDKEDATSPRLWLKDRKGGNWDEWPADVRIREMPEVRA